MQVDQVERVELLSTDSGASAAGTHPVSVVTDTAGVSDKGSSAVSGALKQASTLFPLLLKMAIGE